VPSDPAPLEALQRPPDDGVALRAVVADGPAGLVLLIDSVTQLTPADAGAWAVTGSHGGLSAARYALACPVTLVVYNDAGIGKDGAGVAALDLLQAHGQAAATVSHDSARIGDAADTWAHGVVSRVNAAAAALGLARGDVLRASVLALTQAGCSTGTAISAPASPPSR
jgi:hypothetical protein